MHSKSRRLAAFGARAQSILGDAGHGIDHGVPEMKELFLLLADKWIESPFAMVQTQQDRRRLSRGFVGGHTLSGLCRLRGLFRHRLLDSLLVCRSRITSGGHLCGVFVFFYFCVIVAT